MDQKILQAVLRKDFMTFVLKAFWELKGVHLQQSWHLEVICDQLMRVYTGQTKRLIINVPPRSLKSFIVTVCYPAWVMGQDPRTGIIALSYAQDLSSKFSRETRQLMQSKWYQDTFPGTRINPKKASEGEFETTSGGFRLATSVGGVLTGRGANLIIIDDPLKPGDAYSDTQRTNVNEWVDSTLFTRLDDKQKGAIIVIMQRLHSDDLTGYLLEKRGWDPLCLPAIAFCDQFFTLLDGRVVGRREGELLHPLREPRDILEQLKADMGSMNFSAQYQQQPVPFEGNLLKKEWVHRYDQIPVATRFIQSWDTAIKTGNSHDYSVCTTWIKHKERAYLLDVYRAKLEFPDLVRKIVEMRRSYNNAHVIIEEVGPGMQLVQQLRHQGVFPVPFKPQGDKLERFASITPMFESGQILLPRKAPWLSDLEHELLSFPSVKHDDQVDSITQFLIWHQKSWNNRPRSWSF